MKYPSSLLQENKKKLEPNRIRNWNYLYTRHKPSSDWNEEEGLPDFTKIKIDQSFNWCNFSIPLWTRFNDRKEYLSEYAVAGFQVKTIRFEHIKNSPFTTQVVDVEHIPEPTNYSHCQLIPKRKLTKTEKRELRATLRHNCIVPLKPNQTQSSIHRIFDIIVMLFRRLLSGNLK